MDVTEDVCVGGGGVCGSVSVSHKYIRLRKACFVHVPSILNVSHGHKSDSSLRFFFLKVYAA